jgi:hypothetical protein
LPRYFFHVEDGRLFPDTEGTELIDLDAAKAAAVGAAAELLKGLHRTIWKSGRPWKMRVTDHVGRLLLTLNFSADEVPPLPGLPASN